MVLDASKSPLPPLGGKYEKYCVCDTVSFAVMAKSLTISRRFSHKRTLFHRPGRLSGCSASSRSEGVLQRLNDFPKGACTYLYTSQQGRQCQLSEANCLFPFTTDSGTGSRVLISEQKGPFNDRHARKRATFQRTSQPKETG